MKQKQNPLSITSLFLSLLAILSSIFARGIVLTVFLIPLSIAYYYILKGKVLLKKREGNIIAAVFIIIFIPMFFSFDPFVVGLYFLLGLMSIKLFVSFELKDYDQVALLAFLIFSLSTVFLYSVWFLLLFFMFMFVLTLYLLVRIVPFTTWHEIKPVFKLLYTVPILLVMSLLLFILLPRNPYLPFGLSGVKEVMDFSEVEVGDFQKNSLSERVLLRIKPHSKLGKYIYVRLRVFDIFDGKKWIEQKRWYTESDESLIRLSYNTGKTERYSIMPSYRFNYVPLVDYPVAFSWRRGRFLVNKPTMEIRLKGGFPKMKSYTVFSVNRPPTPLSLDIGYVNYLSVPKNLVDSLRRILSGIEFSHDTLKTLITFLRMHHPYGPFRNDGEYPVLSFLKEGERGECSEFATAFILFARLLGYRSRLVAGFLSSEYNKMGEYFTIREKHAHVWAEIWLGNKWIRFDPTPPLKEKKSLLKSLLEYYDFIQYIWFARVVEFSYQDQMKLMIKSMPILKKFRLKAKLNVFWYAIFSLFAALFLLYYLFKFRKMSVYEQSLDVFFKYMEKMGYSMNKGETLLEFAERSKIDEAIRFVKVYYKVKYGKAPVHLLKKALLKLKNS